MPGGLFPKNDARSVYSYDFSAAWREGKRGVVFDVDNTLVPHDVPADAHAAALFNELKGMGFDTVIVSNNREPRVRKFAEAVGTKYVYKAHKPMPGGILRAVHDMGLEPREVIGFGDQIFTDIWGYNNAGIDSVLVDPVDRSTDEIQIVLKRVLEKPVILLYKALRRKS